jgi:hypothetical protein
MYFIRCQARVETVNNRLVDFFKTSPMHGTGVKYIIIRTQKISETFRFYMIIHTSYKNLNIQMAQQVQWLYYGLDNSDSPIPLPATDFFSFPKIQTCCAVHPISCSVRMEGYFPWERGTNYGAHHHLAPRLRIGGAIPPMHSTPLYGPYRHNVAYAECNVTSQSKPRSTSKEKFSEILMPKITWETSTCIRV